MHLFPKLALVAVITLSSGCGSKSGSGANLNSAANLSAQTVQCVNLEKNARIVVQENDHRGLSMIVTVDSLIVFSKDVSLRALSDRNMYASAQFDNRNNASSTLQLQTWQDGRLRGDFTETSFAPEIPDSIRLYDLFCETN